jgi:hypothetical protein
MNLYIRIVTIFLLVPAFLEVIDSDLLIVNIPGSPLSLGRLCFVFAGFFNYFGKKVFIYNNRIFVAFFLIQIGLFIGAIVSNSIGANLSRTIGIILMIASAFALSRLWDNIGFQKIIHYFLITNFIYWLFYITSNIVSGDKILVYSELFQDELVVNHHISALKLSVSGIYIFYFLLKRNGVYKYFGYLLFFFTVVLCALTESRSNTVFTTLVGALIIYVNSKNSWNLLLTVSGLFFFTIPFISFLEKQEAIFNRFNVSDTEYQQRTTGSRFILLEISLKKIFLTSPLGSGINEIRLDYDSSRKYLVHNQYLSFSIGGGVIAFAGVLVWLSAIFKMFLFLTDKRLIASLGILEVGLAYSLLNFYITLFTVDNTGLFFFMLLSMFLMIYRSLKASKLSHL